MFRTFYRGLRTYRRSSLKQNLEPTIYIDDDFRVHERPRQVRGEQRERLSKSNNINPPAQEKLPEKQVKPEKPTPKETILASQITVENAHETLCKICTPLWNMPYEDQLQMKYEKSCETLKLLTHQLKENRNAHIQVKKAGLPCRVANTRPSPVTEYFRNKDEFSVRTGPDGNPKTVGMFVGSPARGPCICVPCDNLINTKIEHTRLAKHFQDYMRASPLRTCERLDDGGHWRNIIARSNVFGDLMGIVVFHPQQMSLEQLNEEKEKLREYFVDGPGQECELKSLYFQSCTHTRCTNDQAPFELLHGEPYIMEQLGSMSFRISPDSFFQINTKAAEILYSTIAELCEPAPYNTLLDICCGTGTISCFLAPYVRGVIGIDVITDAVKDAHFNATVNSVSNAEFYAGPAETLLHRVIEKLGNSPEIIAVVNPARAGLHPKVIQTIRTNPQIRRLVYATCKPEGVALKNFYDLCNVDPNKMSKPFKPKLAIPVDMFPHTSHCELVVLFER